MDKRKSDFCYLLTPQKKFRCMNYAEGYLLAGTEDGEIYLWKYPSENVFDFEKAQVRVNPDKVITTLVCPFQADYQLEVNEKQPEFINAVALANGFLACACGDYYIRIFNMQNNNMEMQILTQKPPHTITITEKYCAYLSNASCGIIDIQNKKLIHETDTNGLFDEEDHHQLAIIEDTLITNQHMSLKLYDLKTLTKSGEIPFNADGRTANVPNFNFIASKDYIAIFGIDNNIYLWDLPTRSYRGILQGHKAMVLSAVIQYDYIFSTDKEGNIIWWNIKTNKILQEFQTSLEFCEEIFLVGTQLGAKNYLFDIWDL